MDDDPTITNDERVTIFGALGTMADRIAELELIVSELSDALLESSGIETILYKKIERLEEFLGVTDYVDGDCS